MGRDSGTAPRLYRQGVVGARDAGRMPREAGEQEATPPRRAGTEWTRKDRVHSVASR